MQRIVDVYHVQPAAAHLIQLLVARRNADVRRLHTQLHRREGDDDYAAPGHDRERKLALLVIAAAEFEDLDGPTARLGLQNVAQNHDVVGDEFLDAESRHRTVIFGALRSQHRRHSHSLERRSYPEKLAAHHRLVGELGEHRPQ